MHDDSPKLHPEYRMIYIGAEPQQECVHLSIDRIVTHDSRMCFELGVSWHEGTGIIPSWHVSLN